MNKFLQNIFFISLSFVLLLGILIFGVLWTYSNKIPDYKFLKKYKPPVSSKVYSGDGELVADFSREKRLGSVNLTMDIRNAIHGLEVWPFS